MIDITIIENDVNSFQKPMEEEMKTPIKHFEGELLKIRTGRAHTSLVEDIQAMGYSNMPMPLKQLATITAPEARLIVIEPWDPTMLESIEKAILASDTGLTPANDGKIIRLQLPNLSSERREELVKNLGKKTNECKDRVRQVRQEFNNALRDAKKNKKISENFADRLTDILQKVTDKFTAQADQLSEKKATEIRSV